MPRCMRLLASLLVLISALGASIAQAGAGDVPPAVPGFTHTPFSGDDSGRGKLLSGGKVIRSSPVIGEIDRNDSNGKEVAVGGNDGRLYVYKSNGELLWQKDVIPGGCSPADGDGTFHSAPAVGAIYGDGVPYVVVGYGTIQPSNCDGGVIAYRGTDGAEAWRFSLRNFAASQGYREDLYGVLSSPALADTDGDGRMEIGFGGMDRNVHLLNYNGTSRWYYHAADTVWSSPAFANADSDPQLEMVIGTDISADPASGWYGDGGFVYVFDTNARNPLRMEHSTPGAVRWRTFFDQAIYSSPVIADVLPSNPGSEIITGSSCSGDKGGKWIKILRMSDGAVLQTLNAPSCTPSSVAVGNIDDDPAGQLEIVATAQGEVATGGDGKSRIVAWNPNNPNPIWSTIPGDPNNGLNDPYGADLQSPVIADLDGNGSLEVAAANFWSVAILHGKDGRQLTCNDSRQCGSAISVSGSEMFKSTPAVGDINNDGRLDLIIGGTHIFGNQRGLLYAWTGFAGLLKSPAGTQAANSAPWPMFRGNAQHTGALARLTSSSDQIASVIRVGQSKTFTLSIASSDGQSINWTATENSNLIRLDRSTGSSAEQLSLVLTAPGTAGVHTTSVTVQAPGYAPLTIPVTVIAANQVYDVFLPLTSR